MKNKELEVFENRSDDWLAKEKEYEASVSVWDLDEAKEIRKEHHKYHKEYEKKDDVRINSSNLRKDKVNPGLLIFILIVLLFVLTDVIEEDASGIVQTLLPIVIFVVASFLISSGGRK